MEGLGLAFDMDHLGISQHFPLSKSSTRFFIPDSVRRQGTTCRPICNLSTSCLYAYPVVTGRLTVVPRLLPWRLECYLLEARLCRRRMVRRSHPHVTHSDYLGYHNYLKNWNTFETQMWNWNLRIKADPWIIRLIVTVNITLNNTSDLSIIFCMRWHWIHL